MALKVVHDLESTHASLNVQHEFWPLRDIDSKKAKFPCCLVWTPLPVVSWLAPYIGHVGICREDGSILDFSGSYFVNVDDFAFGSVARYVQLDREKCCFPPNLSSHKCKLGYKHAENGSALTWDDALQSSVRQYQSKSYNIFICNCHSFVANCLNRLCYNGSMDWNMVEVAALILFKGRWVDGMSIIRSFFPFALVICLGLFMVGWPFLIGLTPFSFLLLGWYLIISYCVKNLQEC
ncbi:unnamed protein product [Rhodiola kirilowii]